MADDLMTGVRTIQNILIARATGSYPDDEEYIILRKKLMSDLTIKHYLPEVVTQYRNIDSFWQFIKYKFGRYQERKDYLYQEFDRVFRALEGETFLPSDASTSAVLADMTWSQLLDHWQKGLDRKISDPEGAITIARTLIESACKHILDEFNIPYNNKEDLPKLYIMTSHVLDIAPSQQSTETMKQILGGCKTVVDGMGALRNQIGDAHGKGKNHPTIAPWYAELALTLAGGLVTFLVRVSEAKKAADNPTL